MAYGVTYITTQGAILAAKTLQSKTLKFSRFAVGSGETSDDNISTFKALTDLVNEVHEFDITRISKSTDTQVNVKGTFKNTDIEQGFYLKELGLFAIDPDTQNEVLFAYVNYGNKAEYINNSISERKEYFYDIVITADNADNVQIVLNQSSAFVTEQDLQEEAERLEGLINAKANKKKTWDISVDTTWTGTSAPYTKTITARGILATDEPKLYPVYSETLATRVTEKEEYAKISMIKAVANAVELTCDEDKPTVALNLRVEVDY